MKFYFVLCSLAFTVCSFIVRRHDIKDEAYLKLGQQYENEVCNLNLPDGNATFLSKKWIITAAHVGIEIDKKLKKGAPHFINFKGKKYPVEKVVIHEEWNENLRNDIALVQLKEDVSDAQPVELYTRNDEVDKLITIVGNAGIGNGKEGIQKQTDWRYRAATNRIDGVNKYFIKFTFDNPDSPSKYLTELEGVSGPGDSGGPAFVTENKKLYLIGVGSTQSTKHTNGVEGVYGSVEQYMRISSYLDWIQEHMK